MNLDTISKIVLAILPVLAGILEIRRNRGGQHRRIKADLELLASIPEGSEAHKVMLDHVHKKIQKLTTVDAEKRRDVFGTGLALIFIITASGIGYFAVTSSAWWWIIATPVAVFGLAGLGTSFPKKIRDERGRAIKDDPTSSQ